MNNKKVIILVISLIIIVGVYFTNIRVPNKTIVEVVNDFSPVQPVEIVHQEEIEGGILVLYTHKDEEINDLSFVYMKKSLGKYKIVYSGYSGNAFDRFDKNGLYYSGVTNYSESPFPMVWGMAPKSIDGISIIEMNSEKSINVEIREKDNFNIWIAQIGDGVKKIKFIGSNKARNKIIISEILKL